MANLAGAGRRVGPATARVVAQKQAQSKAAIAGSKATQAAAQAAKAAPAPKSSLPGILGKMADIAARKKKR